MIRRVIALLAPVALLSGALACGGSEAAPAKTPEPATTTTAASAAPAVSASAAPAAPASAEPAGSAAPAKPPSRISARHVLIQWMGAERAPASVVRTREQARVVAEDVLKRARGGQDFARLAVEFSDEPGAANRGGSLGRFGRGQMVKSFEDAAFKLAPGEVSDIVESPFGYHIILRVD